MKRKMWTSAFALGLVVSGGPCLRADEAADEARDRDLCRRVAASPLSLRQAIERATRAGERTALAAGFALDTTGRLALTVTTVGAGEDASDFERATGPVLEDGWTPASRLLTDPPSIAEAARAQAILAQSGVDLRGAVDRLATVRKAGSDSVPFSISLRPRVRERTPELEGRVALEGFPWSTRQAVASGAVTSAEPPTYVREHEEAARRRVGKPFPVLDPRGGRWVNVAEAPTLAARRGHPTLLVLTNLACETECGPAPAVLARWRRAYGPAGLEVVTVYRETGFGSARPTLDETAAAVRERGVVHPVLLDPEDELLRALAPGPVGYPVVFLVGRDGLVLWEGVTSLLGFEERCEAALRDTIR